MCQKIKELLKISDGHIISALIHLYNFQTIDEKISRTKHDNRVGFNDKDSTFLTNMVNFYTSRGYLTPNQIGVIRRCILKYVGQLERTRWNRKELKVNKFIESSSSEPINEIKRAKLVDDKKIIIFFQFSKGDKKQFKKTLACVKKIPLRKFDSKEKIWTCPKSLEAAKILKENDFQFNQALQDWYDGIYVDKKYKEMNINLKNVKLYPFQKEGVAFLEERRGRALIADEMGLGKTIQIIAYLSLHSELRPALIIVPASLKLNWEREIKRCIPTEKVFILSGMSEENLHNLPDSKDYIYIANYDILSNRKEELMNLGFKIVILDECQYIKNQKARRSKIARSIAKATDKVVALSGTPIINRPIEFFNTLNILRPDLFNNFMTYAFKYCGARHNGFGWDFNGSSNKEELHKNLINTIMIRRTKIEVIKDLPEKTRAIVPIELDDRKNYERAIDDFSQIAEDYGSLGEALACIEKAKQEAVKSKLENCIKWIENFLESKEKLIVFATHHFVIDKLMEHFKGVGVKLDGRDNAKNKQISIDRFQSDNNIKLFVGNIKAAGVGITLTAASNVAFIELGWSPGEHDQAGDRAHRIGQKNSVTEWYLLADGTIEIEIAELIDKKRENLDAILNGKQTERSNLLMDLLNKYKTKKEA